VHRCLALLPLLLLPGCPPDKRDSTQESPPPVETGESGQLDTQETGHGETGATETGGGETGSDDSDGDTGDTTPARRWVCGVDGIPSDGAPLGFTSLAGAEAIFSYIGGYFTAADSDGDGCSDYAFGSSGGGDCPGVTKVFFGPTLGDMDAEADWTSSLVGQPGDWAVQPASGDIDGDGLADWVIGGELLDGGLGGAYVAYGPVYGEVDLWTEADAILLGQGDYAGGDENRVADMNGDELGDVLLVARAYMMDGVYPGAVYVENGPVAGTRSLSDSDAIIVGDPEQELWVDSISCGGDLDGDGFRDLFVGSGYSQWYTGGVYVIPGPLASSTSVADADSLWIGEGYSFAGYDLSSGGDVDGDGYGDMLVGAPYYGNEGGRAYLLHGPVVGTHSLAEADAIVWASGSTAWVGRSVSLEQDMDGDGRADVAIGAPGAAGAPNRGAVFLFYEPFSGTVNALDEAEAVLYSEVDDHMSATGYRMESAGDINGDGYGDLHIGTLPDYLVFGGPR